MFPITEEMVTMLAPNSSAVTNARKISKQNGFFKLCRSEDETLLFGSCSGSGKTPYTTSIDFINPESPVFRCSCPSRQFPCKHGLALLCDYLAGKNFEVAPIPEDVIAKRSKQEAKKEKAKSDAPKKTNSSAAIKKMKKQVEGLQLAEDFVRDILKTGLATMGANSLKTYQDLAKQFGDYYLPGPQVLMNQLLLELDAIQKDPNQETKSYHRMVGILEQLDSLAKKGKAFLQEKIDTKSVEMEDSVLYTKLGIVWKLEQLKKAGLFQENQELIQLSFRVSYNEAKKEFTDRGDWFNPETGKIYKTENFRPLRAKGNVKQDDTVFELVKTPCLYLYPGEMNQRVRWEEATTRPLTEEDYQAIRKGACQELTSILKDVKNQIKNVLSEKTVTALIAYKRIGMIENQYVLEDKKGDTIILSAPDSNMDTTHVFRYLPDEQLFADQVLVGEFYYNEEERRIAITPLSIVTETQIVRLMY